MGLRISKWIGLLSILALGWAPLAFASVPRVVVAEEFGATW